MKVKPLDQITQKWSTRAQAAGQAYSDGVKAPKVSWSSATSNAEAAWTQGVQAAATAKRFSSGVNKAGDAGWQNGALNKGAGRYASGVAASTSKFSAGFGKFVPVLQNLNLPPRMPKGDPGNMARSAAVGTALHAAKLSG